MSRIRPFYCGSQKADWHVNNCHRCTRGYGGDPEDWHCEIERALDDAYMSDGTVSAEIAERMGFTSVFDYSWKCREAIPNPFIQIQPRVRREMVLAPILSRMAMTLRSAWSYWIPFWDRTDHDAWSGLRSPRVAWAVAWIIHRDSMVPLDGGRK